MAVCCLQESLVNVQSISETALVHYLPPDLEVIKTWCTEHLEVRGTQRIYLVAKDSE